jgi:uncharacterized phage-associated protein
MSVCTDIIKEALQYLLQRINASQHKVKLIKLLFFADKYHFIHYGRTVTNDRLFAMRRGPVGSKAKSIIDPDYPDLDNIHNEDHFFQLDSPVDPANFRFLSKTDLEALDFSVNEFGALNNAQIENESHKYEEWKQYELRFDAGETRREDIFFEDLLSYYPGSPYEQFKEQIELQKEILGS